MQPEDLLNALDRPRANHLTLADAVTVQPSLVKTLRAGTAHAKARVRFGSARVLEYIAETSPRTLLPHFDFFVSLLDHKNRILQWEAIRILAHLVAVDDARRFDRLFRRFFAPIRGPVMITAANIIGSAPVIARARPEWADRIASEVLKVESARYQTTECRNVAIGHAILALGQLLPLLKKPMATLGFVERQRRNPRAATRKKAESFLAKAHRLHRERSPRKRLTRTPKPNR